LIGMTGFSNSSNKHQVSVNPLSDRAANGNLELRLVRRDGRMEVHCIQYLPDPKVIFKTFANLPDTGLGTINLPVCG
jgi:hypothetical protein